MLADRKFKAIKIGLMRSKEFGLLRGVAMHGKTFLTTDIPTAATNGRDCWFNPDFMFKQIRNGDKGAAYVMAHEFAGNIYGSVFYMATGFHGFHVIIGTIFLAVCLMRARKGHFTEEHHFGFEAAAWYWHFVDVVWLFLFAAIYIWGS